MDKIDEKLDKKSNENLHEGHRKRLKERFESEGIESFEEHNIIEMLLFYSIPRKDTNEIAHMLMNKFGTLAEVFDADIDELTKVKGVTKHSATLIKFVGEAWKRYTISKNKSETAPLDNPEKAGDYVCTCLMGSSSEKFLVVCLNNRLNVISKKFLFEGTVNRASVDIRKISEYALEKKASSIIVAHNHPSGLMEPSGDDISLTAKISDVLRILNINFYDHFICCGNEYFSMSQNSEYDFLFSEG